MMKILLLILTGCFVFTAATAQQNERWRLFGAKKTEAQKAQSTVATPTASPVTPTAPASASPTAPVPAIPAETPEKKEPVKGAHLHLPVATHNFGDVPRKGGDLVKEFPFTNDGTAPLVVVRVITSCSCLKATFTKRPVAPGEQGVIRITYEPHKSEPGVFNKVIQIYSNSVDSRDVISVQGNSIEDEETLLKVKTDKVKVKIKE